MADAGKKAKDDKKGKKEKDKEADKKTSKDKLKEKDKEEDKDKDKEKKEDDDMSAVILKGMEQLNELVKTIEEQVAEYIKRKGPLEMTEQYCAGPITNCGPSCLISSFQACPPCPPPSCKPAPPRCPCCGTVCSQR